MRKDQKIFNLIESEKKRQLNGAELIASENFVSEEVLSAMGSVLTNKYAEGYPGKRYYGGCEFVDEIEQLAIDRLKTLFGAEYANVQPHSGAQANAAVLLTCLKANDPILGFNLSHGGHLTHGSPVNFSGINYKAQFYSVEKESGLIDMDEVSKTADRVKPKLIICGASAYARDWDYKRFRDIADEHNAILMADIAHPAGLIATGFLNNPLPHVHIATSTTHKTLRGPRGGIIMMGKNIDNPWGITFKSGKHRSLGSMLNSGVFPGMQGGPLEHVIAAKAIAFGEALDPSFRSYCGQVIKNAKAMADEFMARGYHLISGGTDNHLMLIDLRSKKITGKDAEETLIKAHITVNKNMVPFDTESPMVTSGMRIGSAAITTRGLVEDDCKQIVTWIDELLQNRSNEKKIESIGNAIDTFMSQYPLFAEA